MITEVPDYDLTKLADRFTEDGDYTKDVILEELELARANTDFLVLLSGDPDCPDGFLLGYRVRNSLWLSQIWHNGDLADGREAIEKARGWAKRRGMTSMTGETKRNEMKAMGRYGFTEAGVLMRAEL